MKENIDEAVQRLDSDADDMLTPKTEEATVARQTFVFTSFGKHDELDADGLPMLKDEYDADKGKYTYAEDRGDACAKFEITNRGPIYYVKASTLNGMLYNPSGIYTDEQRFKRAAHKGAFIFEYKRVPEMIFNYYVRFLQTGNQSHLLNAQREII